MSIRGIWSNVADRSFFNHFNKFGFAALLFFAANVYAGSLPIPHWSVPTTITSDDGYADLSWGVSGEDPIKFFRLTERYQNSSAIHFVDHPVTRLFRLKPGEYEFWVQACTRDSAGYPSCGEKSDRLDLTVSESVVPPPSGINPGMKPPPAQVRSPSSLTPGRWHNVNRMGHGWSFYWKSRLALPENDPLYGDAWDLVGLWYTYELRNGIYRPMYAELVFTEVNASLYEGTVLVTRNGETVNSGVATLSFISDSQAVIDWDASFLNESIAGYDVIEQLVAPDSDPVDNYSHYSGLWDAPAPYSYVVSQGLGWTSEAFEIVFQDEENQPSWIIAAGDDPIPGHTDLCFFYVSHGVAPGTSGDIVFYENGCDMDVPADIDNRNGFRRFAGFEEQEVWVNFTLPGGTAPDSFVAGYPAYPHVLQKSASFHRMRYDSASGSACELNSNTPRCELDLTWFTDGNYPDASVFAHEALSGSRIPVWSATVGDEFPWSTAEPGEYVFELRMGDTTESSLMAFSETFEVSGSVPTGPNPEVPPQPASAPDMTPSLASSSTGATVGQFSVSPTGGATYRLPIMTAPGSGGLSPTVALAYDSQSGNGSLGVGWSVEGLSVISRCAPTIEQDGTEQSSRITFSSQDRFCLNGERLMAITGVYGAHGTEYRKEIDDYTRIISYGGGADGPDYFKVWNQEGISFEYGKSEDSRIGIRTMGIGNVAFAWAQNRLEDTAGNFIIYEYNEKPYGPVDFVIDTISYTGNTATGTQPYAEIRFEYENGRDDFQVAYHAGVASGQSRLLRRVDSLSRVNASSPAQFLRSYQLDYGVDGWGRAALESVTECRDTSFTVCFQPTEFTWRKSEHVVSPTGPDVSLIFTADFQNMAAGDVNGDGRADLLITEKKGSDFEFFIAIAEKSGSFTPQLQRHEVPQGDDPGLPAPLTVIDLNADGYQDVLFIRETQGQTQWHARLAGPDGFGDEFVVLGDCCGLKSPTLLQVMDFNGDGLSDIMTQRPVLEFEDASEIVVLINDFQPSGTTPVLRSPLVLDINHPDLFPLTTAGGWEVADEAPVFGLPGTHHLNGHVDEFYGDGSADIMVRLSRLYRRCLGPCAPLRDGGGEPPEPPVFTISGPQVPLRSPTGGDPVEEWGFVTFYVVFFADESGAYSNYEVIAKGADEDCSVSDICSPHFGLPEAITTRAADINADGLADVVYLDADNDWYFRFNDGTEFLAPVLISELQDSELAQLARFTDLNGDGFPEFLHPNQLGDDNARWTVRINDLGHGFSASYDSAMPAGNTNRNDIVGFLDFTADGMVDQLFVDWSGNGTGAVPGTTKLRPGINLLTNQTSDAANVISVIENAFGARSEITYSPLTDPDVYSRMNDSASAQWGSGSVVYDLSVPFYVVSQLEDSAPVFADSDATNVNQYHYVGAKLQGGGRGLLGFAEVVQWDPENQLRTHTRFRQDFPYTGLKAESRTYITNKAHKADIITDISRNDVEQWPSIGPLTQVQSTTVHGSLIRYTIREYLAIQNKLSSKVWALTNPAELHREYTLEGDFKSKTFRSMQFDSFGNIVSGQQRIYTSDNAAYWSSISTSNVWMNDTSRWRLGRLTSTEVEHWRSDATGSIVRNSSFGYDSQSSLLIRETTQPGSASHQVITQYELDDFGNRTATSVTGIGMPTRRSMVQFESLGRFATESKNPYNQVTQSIDHWDVFGNPLQTFNIDNVLTQASVDDMGRLFASYSENGSWSITAMGQGGHAQCPAGTAYHSETSVGGGARSIACHDVLGRKMRSANQGFLGGWIYTDSYFDESGLPERLSEPYFSGNSRYWNFTQYDSLGRVSATTAANGLVEEVFHDAQAAHCGQSGLHSTLTRTNPQDGTVRMQWEQRNPAGETVRILDDSCGEVTHDYDAVGNLVRTTGIDGSVITIEYDDPGLHKIQLSDPDKGVWQYASNPLGEVTRQLDSRNQAIDFEYDLLGRVTHRRELSNVQSLNDNSFETVNHEIRHWQNSTVSGITGRGQVWLEMYRDNENGTVLHQRNFDFDDLGRVAQITHQLEDADFIERATYDQFGRPFQQFDASGDFRGIRFHYNASGYPEKLQEAREGTDGVVYQTIEAMDQRGNPTAVTLGNQVQVFAEFEDSSGYVETLEAYDASGGEIQFVDYEFDKLGNLLERHDRSGTNDMFEEFEYDRLNRLERVLLTAPHLGLNQHLSQDMTYSPDGNITFKLGVGSYSYGSGSAGPHAVTRAGNTTYSYDANGNQTSSSDGRTISYSVFDKAERIARGSEVSEFSYGLGNRRYKRADNNAVDQIKTTLTVGSVEHIQQAGSAPYFKRHVMGVAIVDFYPASQLSDTWYLTKDHLGSVHSISDDAGVKVHENHFGPWGMRQDTDWQSSLPVSALIVANGYTTKGFTGHEHADGLGVIHMKGRIYDPRLGRFLQADPFVQAPRNGQSLNRYSYALNNPLSYTDPSGYFFKRLIRKWGRVIVAAVISYYSFGLASNWAFASMLNAAGGLAGTANVGALLTTSGVIGGAVSGFVGGAILSGSLRGAVKGAFAGAIAGGIAENFGDTYNLQRIASDSAAGGLAAEINGRDFKDGLMVAALTSVATYVSVRARKYQIAQSRKVPNNIGSDEFCFRGLCGKIQGERINIETWNKNPVQEAIARGVPVEDVISDVYAELKGGLSPLGCFQAGDSCFFGLPVDPSGFMSYTMAGFGGVHDSLNQPFFYNSNGTNRPLRGFLEKAAGKIINPVNVFLAAPIAIPALVPDYMRHLYLQER